MIYYPVGTTLRIFIGIYWHYGIADGFGNVIHNSKRWVKVVIESEKDFSCGRRVEVSKIAGNDMELAAVKAQECIGKPYNLFTSNCEHFVRSVHGLSVESIQLQKYTLAMAGVLALRGKSDVGKAMGVIAVSMALLIETEKKALLAI